MISKEYYNLMNKLEHDNDEAFVNHEKMIKYLDSMGIIPNPVQRVIVDTNSYRGIPAQQENKLYFDSIIKSAF